jgi:uncharacterized protein (TIGR02569 family)
MHRTPDGPPREVWDAFGLTGPVQSLPGGEGHSLRVGDAVLKPVADELSATWMARVLSGLEGDGFRVPRPVRARDGRWVVHGWSAAEFVDGETGPAGRWAEVLAAGRAFHAALRATPCPAFLADRDDRWAVGDRVAWREEEIDALPELEPLLRRLLHLLPTDGASPNSGAGLVHGDLSGNVLFAPGQPPAIIDFSPYCRPPAYADAIVTVDGLLWSGATPALVELAATGTDFPRMLARATIFRLVALDGLARQVDRTCRDEQVLFAPVVALVEALCRPVG